MHKLILVISAAFWITASASYATWSTSHSKSAQEFQAWEIQFKAADKNKTELPSPPSRRSEWEAQAAMIATGGLSILLILIGAWMWWLDEKA